MDMFDKILVTAFLFAAPFSILMAQNSSIGIGLSGHSSLASYTLGGEVSVSTNLYNNFEVTQSAMLGVHNYAYSDPLQRFHIITRKAAVHFYYPIINRRIKWKLGLGASVISESTRYVQLVDYHTEPTTVIRVLHRYIKPCFSFRTKIERSIGKHKRYSIGLIGGADGFSLEKKPIDDLFSYVKDGISTRGLAINVSTWAEKRFWHWNAHICISKRI
jgi:hypothetical protein